MKKILLSTVIAGAALMATTANAQLQKGNLMVGGDLANLGLGLQSGNTSLSFQITPKVGYFIQDNIAIGGQATIGLSTSKGFNSINYGIGAFGRYYVSDPRAVLLKHSRFFAEVDFGIVGDNQKTTVAGVSTSVSTNGLGVGLGPGVSYFITPNIGLEALLKYNLGVGFGNSVTTNKFSINVGFQIYLPTKQARSIYNEAKSEVEEKTED